MNLFHFALLSVKALKGVERKKFQCGAYIMEKAKPSKMKS